MMEPEFAESEEDLPELSDEDFSEDFVAEPADMGDLTASTADDALTEEYETQQAPGPAISDLDDPADWELDNHVTEQSDIEIDSASSPELLLAEEPLDESETLDPIFVPIALDHTELPIPADGFPWSDAALIGHDLDSDHPAGLYEPASPVDLRLDLVTADANDGMDPQASDDPAISALGHLWA